MKKTKCEGAIVAAGAILMIGSASGQGPLVPPGAPGGTMRSLTEVYSRVQMAEPRTPVTSAPYTVSQPGSYYLTTNLSGMISIAANNVTLDLMGFTIAPASGTAISQNGARTNLVIRNGGLSAPMGNGIDLATSTSGANGRIEDIRVDGCMNYAIVVGGGYEICGCRIQGAGIGGIRAYGNSCIRDCTVTRCGKGLQLSGTGARVEGNRILGNTDNYDFAAGNQLNLLLCELPEVLDRPCLAKLAGTLVTTLTETNGITVAADDVTIDFAGHALVGPGLNSGHGIYQSSSYRNLTAMNGKLVNWRGLGNGGIQTGPSAILSGLQASTNEYGIISGIGSSLDNCAAFNNDVYGIRAGDANAISDCTGIGCGVYGIHTGSGCTLKGCAARNNGTTEMTLCGGIYAGSGSELSQCAATDNTGFGILTGFGCTLSGCTALDNAKHGINVNDGSTVSDCTTRNNAGSGIYTGSNCHIAGCLCHWNGYPASDGAGIYVAGNGNRIEGNAVSLNDRGIHVPYAGNFIVRNTANGNTTNWVIVSGNVCLVVQAATAGAISGNSGGTAPGSTDPNANFTY